MGKASKKRVGNGSAGSVKPTKSASPARSAGKPAAGKSHAAAIKAAPPPAKSSRPTTAAVVARAHKNGASRGKAVAATPATRIAGKPPAPVKAVVQSKVVQTKKVAAPPPPPEPRMDARATRAQKPARVETNHVEVKPAKNGRPEIKNGRAENGRAGSGRTEVGRVEPKPERRESSPLSSTPTPPPQPPSPPVPRVDPVSSSGDSKPKKNQAGLSSKELDVFRDLLLEKRRELIGDMNSMEREALAASEGNLSTLPIHMADMGTDNYEQEFTLGLVEKDRVLLREINHALAKIQNGSYGICEGNGQPIGKVRLEAQPWARHSIEFVRSKEKRAGHR